MTIQHIPGTGSVSQPASTRRAEAPAAKAPAAPPAPPAADHQQVQEVAHQLRQIAAPVARNLQFSVDGDTGKTVIRVVDSATKEVIRQIPNEEVLAIARAMDRLQGLLLKGKA